MKITTRNTNKSNIEKEALWVKKLKKKKQMPRDKPPKKQNEHCKLYLKEIIACMIMC